MYIKFHISYYCFVVLVIFVSDFLFFFETNNMWSINIYTFYTDISLQGPMISGTRFYAALKHVHRSPFTQRMLSWRRDLTKFNVFLFYLWQVGCVMWLFGSVRRRVVWTLDVVSYLYLCYKKKLFIFIF